MKRLELFDIVTQFNTGISNIFATTILVIC